ncbi:MAG TPA: putative metal-binding motif-containing protein [Polyangiaceae bacterium]|nr:putative metal-binding motif-containing protein [Polyangiaceae bacterium]
MSTRRLLLAGLVLSGACGSACGARTGVEAGDAGAPPQPCVVDSDCATGDACSPAECREGVCAPLPTKVCDDNDECTTDSCDPNTAACIFTPRTPDRDGDGYRAPLPGFAPGAPGSCGNDCDDSSAAAHPGGVEVCDGVDNDCNGQIDDGAAYGGASQPVRVSASTFDRTSRGGIAFDGKNYGANYSGHDQIWSSYFTGLSRSGAAVVADTPMTDINSETYAGILLHNGSYFESSWSDARQDGNYEVYFNRYDSNGKKLGPDLRITNAPNFSLNSVMVWNGIESLVVWDDRRFEGPGGNDVRLFGQRIGFDGSAVGGNVQLTPQGTLAEYPGMALGQTKVGIVFASQVGDTVHAKFFTTAPDFTAPSAFVDLSSTDVQNPNLVYVGGHFLVAWERYNDGSGPSIYGALVDESGTVLVPERAITSGADFARSFALLSLGERVILVWADDHDGNYELYWQMLDSNLQVVMPRTRLTTTPTDTLYPATTFGPNGDIGILYDDWLTGERQSYFLSMGCVMPAK